MATEWFTWWQAHWGQALEVFGVVTSLLYLFFSIRQSLALWPLGILSSAVYVAVFFQSQLYADAGLYIYYVVVSIYGWWNWHRGRSESQQKDDLPVTQTRPTEWGYLGLISLLLFALLAWALQQTDSDVPYGDAFTTALSAIATWMLAKKRIEQWLIWIVVDLFAMGLYIYKQLYPTAGLFAVYTIMAVIGYGQWKRHLKNNGIKYANTH